MLAPNFKDIVAAGEFITPYLPGHRWCASRTFLLTNRILWELLDDFLLVSDTEINAAIRLLARHAKQIAEGAGAASLAAAIRQRKQVRGKKVVGIVTGENISPERLASLMAD